MEKRKASLQRVMSAKNGRLGPRVVTCSESLTLAPNSAGERDRAEFNNYEVYLAAAAAGLPILELLDPYN